MFIAIRKRLEDREEGFTLIELLVVVIIIGILAAIAIPTFLSQRQRGWQAELTSQVRNAALEVEAAATANNGVYPADAAGQAVVTPFTVRNAGGNLVMAYTQVGGGASFTICGTHPQITNAHSQTYNSAARGLQPFNNTAGC